jgi:hypothetical protein
VLLALAAPGSGSAAEWEVRLVVPERCGVARVSEPVTMGIPLTKGQVADVSMLSLVDPAGREVPCQFGEVSRWLDGKSVKWALMNFRASVAANYYDFPNASLIQFLRTGDHRFWDRFLPNAMHVGDVFICHYHPNKALCGSCRFCPPRNHVATDDGKPYVSVEFNHNKSQCVFALYYLTGDLRALDNCRLIANNAVNNHEADSAKQARGPGAHLAALWQTYELWPTPAHLERMRGMARRSSRSLASHSKGLGDVWIWGIGNEGLVYYLWAVGKDEEVEKNLQAEIDKLGDRADKTTSMALGNAYLYALTGDAKYAELAWKSIKRDGVSNRPKSFGGSWRNSGFALYFLSKACKPGEFRPDE